MGLQGFIGNEIVFHADGSITETNADGDVLLTAFPPDGSIEETFTSSGMSITKKTVLTADTIISEVIL